MTEQLAMFAAVPARAPRPSEPVIRSAVIEGPYRWTMTRAWGAGPTILWTLFNASDADGKRDDPTTLRMMGFSYRWGFGAMIVTNVYPFIASKPKDLHAWRRTFDWKAYEADGMPAWELDINRSSWAAFHHNQRLISDILIKTPELTCVAAWGLGPNDADLDHFLHGVGVPRDHDCDSMGIVRPDWYCIGKTASGAPIHPLARGRNRIPDDAALKIWKRRPREQPERYG
jgi:Protein of unknown function (DUF1643)